MVMRIDVWVENGIIQLLVYFRFSDVKQGFLINFNREGVSG